MYRVKPYSPEIYGTVRGYMVEKIIYADANNDLPETAIMVAFYPIDRFSCDSNHALKIADEAFEFAKMKNLECLVDLEKRIIEEGDAANRDRLLNLFYRLQKFVGLNFFKKNLRVKALK